MTIHEFVCRYWHKPEEIKNAADADYAAALRIIVADWLKNGGEKAVLTGVRQIKNVLKDCGKAGYLFHLPDDPSRSVPECTVDFTAAYTVPRSKLWGLEEKRIATVRGDYRTAFARGFADFISRIALERLADPGIPA
jgi:hypothetical protein